MSTQTSWLRTELLKISRLKNFQGKDVQKHKNKGFPAKSKQYVMGI